MVHGIKCSNRNQTSNAHAHVEFIMLVGASANSFDSTFNDSPTQNSQIIIMYNFEQNLKTHIFGVKFIKRKIPGVRMGKLREN